MLFLSNVLLPIALAVIMLGLGLALTAADFRRVMEQPIAVISALVCQIVLMPVVCYAITVAFRLPPELAVGMMVVAASPGGTSANLYSHVSNGDVALNITLTAVNSLLSLFTLPLIINFSLLHFIGEDRAVPLQFAKIVQVFAVVLVPVAIGMFVRHRWPHLAQRLGRPVKILSALFLLLLIAMVMTKSSVALKAHAGDVGLACILFSAISLGVGYGLSRLIRLAKATAIAIGMEVGVHNAALAITISISPLLLDNPTIAIPPTIYGLVMLFTAAAFGFLVNLGGRTAGTAGTS